MVDQDQGRGAIGTQSSQDQQQNITYGAMPEQLISRLRDNPTGEFIVIQRVRQSEEPQVWSTGDPAQSEDLFRHAYTSLAFKEPATA